MMLANVLSLGAIRRGGGQPSYDPDAEALFTRFTTPPTSGRKGLINDLVLALKSAGVWAKLDALYVRAAADSQAARLNWIAAAYDSAAFSSPVFMADRGFTPDGATSYLTSGFDPTTAVSPKFTQNNGHLGAYHLTDLPNGSGVSFDIGNLNSRIVNNASAATQIKANSTVTSSSIAEDYAVHKLFTRDGASSWRYYNDGALVGGDPRADASAALTAFEIGTGRTGATAFGLNQEAISHFGSHLLAGEITAMVAAFSTYLAAVGAI